MKWSQENLHTFSGHSKDVQDLLNRIQDARSKLQSVKTERENVCMEVHKWREEMDRRMPMLLHAGDEVCAALLELEAVKLKKQELIKSLNARTRERKLSNFVSVMQKQVKALEEEEKNWKLKCEDLRKALNEI